MVSRLMKGNLMGNNNKNRMVQVKRPACARHSSVDRMLAVLAAVIIPLAASLAMLTTSPLVHAGSASPTMTKTPSPTTFTMPGEEILYTYVITAPSPADTFALNSLTDDKIGNIDTNDCVDGMNGALQTVTCTAVYVTNSADVMAGTVVNNATAKVDVCGDGCIRTLTAKAAIGLGAAWTMTKTPNPSSYSAAGQTINYQYVLTNTGGQDIGSIVVTDDKVATVTCPQPTLAIGASMTCTGSYLTKVADMPNSIVNMASASGLPAAGVVANATAQATVAFTPLPSWTLSKTPNPTTYSAAGVTINYSYLVTNTGNVTINAISVSDNKVATVNCPAATLAAGANMTCTGSYVTKAADLPNSIVNLASATGTPAGGVLGAATAQATVTFVAQPSWTLTKTPNPTSYGAAGVTVNYSYVVRNTGNVTINAIAITDDRLSPVTCPQASLAAGANMTCTGSYVTKAADMPNAIVNSATAMGTPAAGVLAPATAQATVSFTAQPTWSMTNTPNPSTYSTVGALITFTDALTNTGNVTIQSIVVTDVVGSSPGTSGGSGAPGLKVAPLVNCPSTTLAPGQTMNCTRAYTTTAADVANGAINSTATATGAPALGALAAANAQAAVALVGGQVSIRVQTLGSDSAFQFSGSLVTANAAFASIGTVNGTGIVGPFLLNAGTYTITEAAPATFSLTGVSCVGDNNSVVNVGARSATINLDAGEVVVCTFVNSPVARPIPVLLPGTLLLMAGSLLLAGWTAIRRRPARRSSSRKRLDD